MPQPENRQHLARHRRSIIRRHGSDLTSPVAAHSMPLIPKAVATYSPLASPRVGPKARIERRAVASLDTRPAGALGMKGQQRAATLRRWYNTLILLSKHK
jgi:hypothetical protein